MTVKNQKKPAITKGLKWGLFSVTATFCAFLLPIFIFALISTPIAFDPPLPDWIMIIIFLITLFCALYHSIYRIFASDHDLQLKRKFLFWIGSIITIMLILEIINFSLINSGSL